MNIRSLAHLALLVAATALVAACGGNDSGRVGAQEFVGRVTAQAPVSDALRPLAARPDAAPPPSGTISNAQLFQWAQGQFRQYFGTATPQSFSITHEGKLFDVRGYTVSGQVNYAGISAQGEVYGLGAYTGNQLVKFGMLQDFACIVAPALCEPVPGGTLNACGDPAMAGLPTGARSSLTYLYTGLINREQTVNSVVDGPNMFEGQNAVQVTTTTMSSFTNSGVTTNSTLASRSYLQSTTDGLTKTLGNLSDLNNVTTITAPGLPTLPGTASSVQTKTVFSPPTINNEFTLSIGGSIEKSVNQTTTTLAMTPLLGSLPPPLASSHTERHTFEARENITVLGKTYDSCRYKVTVSNGTDLLTHWYMAGKGIPVKTVSATANGQVQLTIELKSGTYNGSPL